MPKLWTTWKRVPRTCAHENRERSVGQRCWELYEDAEKGYPMFCHRTIRVGTIWKTVQ